MVLCRLDDIEWITLVVNNLFDVYLNVSILIENNNCTHARTF